MSNRYFYIWGYHQVTGLPGVVRLIQVDDYPDLFDEWQPLYSYQAAICVGKTNDH